MEDYKGPEKREYPRADTTLVVSYRIKQAAGGYDISQARNVSQGGILLTTNRAFANGTRLALTLRLPFLSDAIEVVGEVVGSSEIVRDLIYDARVHFLEPDGRALRELREFVQRPTA